MSETVPSRLPALAVSFPPFGTLPYRLKDNFDTESEVAALFVLPELSLIYLNSSGRRCFDREGTIDFAAFTLNDMLGVSTSDRFRSDILLKTRVLGQWVGDCELRDAWGSSFMAHVTLTNRRFTSNGGADYLCLHAAVKQQSETLPNTYVADRELLHALMHSSPDSIYFKDRDSRFLRVSRAMSVRFKLKEPRDVIGKTDFDFFTIEHASKAFGDEQKILKTGIPIIAAEEEETWSDGRVTWVSTTKMPLHDSTGEVVGTFGISYDITQSKVLAQERQELEMQLQLNSKLESIGRLAAGVAHEINTPTQYIATNTRFLDQAFKDFVQVTVAHRILRDAVAASSLAAQPAVMEALQVVKRVEAQVDLDYLLTEIPLTLKQTLEGLGRVGRIVHSLKEFSHPSATDKVSVDLNRIIENAVTVCRHEWKYVAELSTDLDGEVLPMPCIADQIGQVILNIVINAAHAVGDAIKLRKQGFGYIKIRTKHSPEAAMIEIEDSGGGIPAEVLPRIFEPFYTTKAVGKGTGQGLALVKTIVETNHQGAIQVETKVGVGTIFRITLPYKSELTSANPPHPVVTHAEAASPGA